MRERLGHLLASVCFPENSGQLPVPLCSLRGQQRLAILLVTHNRRPQGRRRSRLEAVWKEGFCFGGMAAAKLRVHHERLQVGDGGTAAGAAITAVKLVTSESDRYRVPRFQGSPKAPSERGTRPPAAARRNILTAVMASPRPCRRHPPRSLSSAHTQQSCNPLLSNTSSPSNGLKPAPLTAPRPPAACDGEQRMPLLFT